MIVAAGKTIGVPGLPGVAGVIAIGLMLAGCLKSSRERAGDTNADPSGSGHSAQIVSLPEEIDPAVMEGRRFGEAPILTALVESGELPPVSERLPERPLVIRPVRQIGIYGGAIRRALASDINDSTAIRKTLSENLMGYERPVPGEPIPHLAESYEFLDEGRSAVFRLRRGIRWSDGEPFTVDDILFWYEDMMLDENARNDPLFPSIWLNGGQPLRMEKIDALTLKISSDQVMGGIFVPLCYDLIAVPRHVFAQHHPRHNPDADYASFRAMTTAGILAFEPGIPRLSAWVPAEWVHGQRALFRRNPYYWKVDTAGNQLPYADELEFSIIRNEEVVLLKFLNGQINLYDYAISDKFGMMKNEESKGSIVLRYTAVTPTIAIFPNLDAPNPSLREAFRDRRVRLALSHALNREEIGAILQNGFLRPVAFSLDPANPSYSKEGARLHSQYDPGKSCRLLDEAGYRDSDGDGFREFRDGSVFTLTIDVFNNPGMVDLCEFLAEYWGAVGLKTILNIGLQEMLIPRRISGTFEVHVTSAPVDPLSQAQHFGVMGPYLPFWHRNADVEGPEWLAAATVAIHRAQNTIDRETIMKSVVEIRDIYTRELPFIMIGAAPMVWACSNRLGNVADDIPATYTYRGFDRAVFHEQLFLKPDSGWQGE